MAKTRTIDEALETVETTEAKVEEVKKETTTVISTYGNNCKFTVGKDTIVIFGECIAGKNIDKETEVETALWNGILKRYAKHPLIKNQVIVAK